MEFKEGMIKNATSADIKINTIPMEIWIGRRIFSGTITSTLSKSLYLFIIAIKLQLMKENKGMKRRYRQIVRYSMYQ